jgi:hypothetical protein
LEGDVAQETPVQRLDKILGAGSASRAPRYIETPAATSRRLLATGIPQTYETPYEPPQDDGDSLADMLKRRAGQGAGRFFSSNLNPLNIISLGSRYTSSSARELVDLFDSDSSTKASFGDLLKQTFDTSYGFGTAFPMKGWKGRIVGFAGDVLLDPLTYATFGGTVVVSTGVKAARYSAKALGRIAAKEFTQQSAGSLGRAATRRGAKAAYEQAYERGLREFGSEGGRAVLGKQAIGREGRQKLAQHVDRLLEADGVSIAVRNETARNVAARGKGALYDTAEGMRVLNRLGVSGPGVYYFGSRVKVPGTDVIAKMIEKGVTGTRLGVSRSDAWAPLVRSFTPAGTGRLGDFGPQAIGEIRASLQVGKPIRVGGQELDPVLGLKLLEVDDLRRIGVAQATENWDVPATRLVNNLAAWQRKHGSSAHLFFDGRGYIPGLETTFNNSALLSRIESASPGATAELEALYTEYQAFMKTVRDFIVAESAGTGRTIGNIAEGYVPRRRTPEYMEWLAKYFPSTGPDELAPSRYANGLQSRTLDEGISWFGHRLRKEDLTIERLNELASKPTKEWFDDMSNMARRRSAGSGVMFSVPPPPPQVFRNDTPSIFIDYVRAMAEQVGTFRMAKALLDSPEYARALDSLPSMPAGVQHTAEEVAEVAGRYQSTLAEYHRVVGALRNALDLSFDEVAARTLVEVADDAGSRTTLQLMASHVESGALLPEVVDDVAEAVGEAIDIVGAQIDELQSVRSDFESLIQNEDGVIEGNYSDIAVQLDEVLSEFAAIQDLHRRGRQIPVDTVLPNWQRNRILSDVIDRLERHTEKVESLVRLISRWSSVEDVMPRLDVVDPLNVDSFYKTLLRQVSDVADFSVEMSKKRSFATLRTRRLRFKGRVPQYKVRGGASRGGSDVYPVPDPDTPVLDKQAPLRARVKGAYDDLFLNEFTDEEWLDFGAFNNRVGTAVNKAVKDVGDYDTARARISSLIEAFARGNADEVLSPQQLKELRDVFLFVIGKHSHAELARYSAGRVPSAELLYDDLVYYAYYTRTMDDYFASLAKGESLASPILQFPSFYKHELRPLYDVLFGRVKSGQPTDFRLPSVYALQDALHYAASTEQVWQISTSLRKLGLKVGDDVISAVLAHNSDTYVIDALRLGDTERLARLRPQARPDGTGPLPYGRMQGADDPFSDSFRVTTEEVLSELDEIAGPVADSSRVNRTTVDMGAWPPEARNLHEVLMSKMRNAERRLQQAQQTMSDFDSSPRSGGGWTRGGKPIPYQYGSRSLVRNQTDEIGDDFIGQLYAFLRQPVEQWPGNILDLAEPGANANWTIGSLIMEPLMRIGMTMAEASDYQASWWAANGEDIMILLGLYQRLRLHGGLADSSQLLTAEEARVLYVALETRDYDPARLGEFNLPVLEALIADAYRVGYIDAASIIDNEYEYLRLGMQEEYAKAVYDLQAANVGLERLRGNPRATFILSDTGDTVDYRFLGGDELSRELVHTDPTTARGQIDIEIDALQSSDDFFTAKVFENYHQTLLQLSRVRVPDGETFLGLTQSQIDDFFQGGVFSYTDEMLDNPSGKRVVDQNFIRLQVENYLAAGNTASVANFVSNAKRVKKMWAGSSHYAYLRRIEGLRAEKVSAAIDELDLSDDLDILLGRIRGARSERLNKLQQMRDTSVRSYLRIEATSQLLEDSVDEAGQPLSGFAQDILNRLDEDARAGLEARRPELEGIRLAQRQQILERENAARQADSLLPEDVPDLEAPLTESEIFDDIDVVDAMMDDPEAALQYVDPSVRRLSRQLRADREVGNIVVPSNLPDELIQNQFDLAAQNLVVARVADENFLRANVSYILRIQPKETATAIYMLRLIDETLELIDLMKRNGYPFPASLSGQGSYSRLTRELRRTSERMMQEFPDSYELVDGVKLPKFRIKPGRIQLATGDLADIKRQQELSAFSVDAFDFPWDPSIDSDKAMELIVKKVNYYMRNRGKIKSFRVKNYLMRQDFLDPDRTSARHSQFERLLSPAGKSADRRTGFYLDWYDEKSGDAIFRNYDFVPDEIGPNTQRFDASVGPGGSLPESVPDDVDAVRVKSGLSDDVALDDYVEMAPPPVNRTTTVSVPRLEPGVARPPGVRPERTFSSLDQLKQVLGVEATPTPLQVVSEPVVTPAAPFPLVVSGYSAKGRGTPLGDGKDVAMREVADSAIVELDATGRASSSRTTIDTLGSPQSSSRVVMLARNGSLRGRSLRQETIDAVRQAHDNGARFVVGDMPEVDQQFVALLDEIGAQYTVYTSGKPRISVRGYGSSQPPAVVTPAAAAPVVPAPPTPIPTPVAAYDQVQAITTPNVLTDSDKANQGKAKLAWLIDNLPADASPQWRAAFTDFVDRATVWLERTSTTGKLDPGIEALLASHFESEMAFMESALRLGEMGTQRAYFSTMSDLIDASTRLDHPERGRAKKIIVKAIEDNFPKGWEQLHDEFYPNIVVNDQLKALWSQADFRRDPDWMDNGIVEVMQELTKFHKAYSVMTPGFHVRNAIGNAFTLLFAGANMKNVARGVQIYHDLQAHLKTGAAAESFIAQLPQSDQAIVTKAREAMFASGGGIFSSTYKEAREAGKLSNLYDNRLTRFNYDVGQYSDEAVRFAFGFDIITRGGDRDAAQIAIKRFFFDYEDLSKADKYIKEVIPFWLWSSRNFISQIQNIFLEPKRYAIYMNLKKNLREDDEEKTSKKLPFVAELGGFELPVGRNLYFVPDMGAARAVQLPYEYSSYKLVNSFTPWARIPIETVLNRRSFTDKPVYDEPQDFAAYLAASGFPPYNQLDRTGILPGGKPINWNAISSFLGSPVRKYGD